MESSRCRHIGTRCTAFRHVGLARLSERQPLQRASQQPTHQTKNTACLFVFNKNNSERSRLHHRRAAQQQHHVHPSTTGPARGSRGRRPRAREEGCSRRAVRPCVPCETARRRDRMHRRDRAHGALARAVGGADPLNLAENYECRYVGLSLYSLPCLWGRRWLAPAGGVYIAAKTVY